MLDLVLRKIGKRIKACVSMNMQFRNVGILEPELGISGIVFKLFFVNQWWLKWPSQPAFTNYLQFLSKTTFTKCGDGCLYIIACFHCWAWRVRILDIVEWMYPCWWKLQMEKDRRGGGGAYYSKGVDFKIEFLSKGNDFLRKTAAQTISTKFGVFLHSKTERTNRGKSIYLSFFSGKGHEASKRDERWKMIFLSLPRLQPPVCLNAADFFGL